MFLAFPITLEAWVGHGLAFLDAQRIWDRSLAPLGPLGGLVQAIGEGDVIGPVLAIAMLALGVVALLVVATNAFALLFLLPSLHIWLWLPQVRHRSPAARFGLLAAGLVGPFILVGSFMFRYGLGLDAPWYLAELAAIGYVSIVPFVFVLCWLAGAAQLSAIAAGRYAPYPSAAERPPRGPIRNTIRAVVLGLHNRRRRRAPAADGQALEL
jgi:hypothetical protein